MFVDKVSVTLKAGDGGNGVVSFRHEKYVDKGGPDGGDGGNGGDIILRASTNQNTLSSFRYKKLHEAEPGKPGFSSNKHGRSGKDLIIDVPVGTVVSTDDGYVLADLTTDGQETIIAKGGRGGFGNAHFVSSTRQAPKVAEKGEPGQQVDAVMEIKLIADVGLVGLPNAGKSSFLSSVSNARPEIANYPFTTLTPSLGVVDIDKKSLLIADIPGLIEGASQGKGLGDEFLRHIERTSVLLHLIDIYDDNLGNSFTVIRKELEEYSKLLADKPTLVALTKIEGLDDEMIVDRQKELQSVAGENVKIFAISSHSKKGIKELLYALSTVVEAEKNKLLQEEEKNEGLPRITLAEAQPWTIEKVDNVFYVRGNKIERFAVRTDFESFHAEQRLRDIMRKMGITHHLERMGIEKDQKVVFMRYGKEIGHIEY